MPGRKELYAAVKLIKSYCTSRLTSNERGLSYMRCSDCDFRFLCYSKQLQNAPAPVNWPDPPEEVTNDLSCGKYVPIDPSLPADSCGCASAGQYNDKCEFYHKEYHMGGCISTCLDQDIFGWCECGKCPKNMRR